MKTFIFLRSTSTVTRCIVFGVLCAAGLTLTAPLEISRYVEFDSNTAAFAAFARNLARYPIALTHGAMTHLVGAVPTVLMTGTHVHIHPDHPPLIVWAAAVLMKLFGADILVSRLTCILATAGVAVMTVKIAFDRLGSLSAFVAGAVLLAMPIFRLHALQLNFEPVACFLILIAVYFFARFMDGNKRSDFVKAMIVWILALLTDWPSYFLGLPFILVALSRRDWTACCVIAVLPPAFYMGIMGGYGLLNGNGLWYPIDFAMSNMAPHYDLARYDFDTRWSTIFREVWRFAQSNFRLGFILAGAGGCVLVVARGRSTRTLSFILAALLTVAVLNIVAFKFWAMIHPYWSYYFMPVIALGVGALFSGVRSTVLKWAAAIMIAVGLPAWAAVGLRDAVRSGNLYTAIPSLQQGVNPQIRLLLSAAEHANDIYSSGDYTLHGHGYVLRWYLDRPLTRPSAAGAGGECRRLDDLVLVNDADYRKLPADLAPAFHRIDLGASWWASLGDLSAVRAGACKEALARLRP